MVTMRRAGQLVYSALFGRAGTEEPVPTESTTSSSHSYSVSSLSSGGSLEAEEVEDHYGSAESNSRGSSSYSDFRASDSDADGRGRRAPREGEGSTGSAHSRVVADARNLASELGSETAVIDDGRSPPHHGQSSTWSRRGRNFSSKIVPPLSHFHSICSRFASSRTANSEPKKDRITVVQSQSYQLKLT